MKTMKQTKGNIVKHIFSKLKGNLKRRNKIKSKQKRCFFYSNEKNIPKEECDCLVYSNFKPTSKTNKNTKVNKRNILLQET